jgi:hypothetical protein
MTEWLTLPLRFREVPGSILRRETGYVDWDFRGFPQALQANSTLQLGNNMFLPNPFQLII